MIYTGYFANTKKYIEAGLIPVSVAGRTPDFFNYPKWTKVAPRKELFYRWKKGEVSDEEYMIEYEEYLSLNITPASIKKLKKLIERKDIIMCCYEKSSNFCHRHTLARWLSKKLGVDIREFKV